MAARVAPNDEKAAIKGFPIKLLDPDIDGDGKYSAEEAKIFKIIKDADADGSGYLTPPEFYSALGNFVRGEKVSSQRKKMLLVAIAACFVLVAVNMGLTFAVVFLAKDTQATKGATKSAGLFDKKGKAVATKMSTMQTSLFHYPSKSDKALVQMLKTPIMFKRVNKKTLVIQPSGFERKSNTSIVLSTCNGRTIHLTTKLAMVLDSKSRVLLKQTAGGKMNKNATVGVGRRLEGEIEGEITTVEVVNENGEKVTVPKETAECTAATEQLDEIDAECKAENMAACNKVEEYYEQKVEACQTSNEETHSEYYDGGSEETDCEGDQCNACDETCQKGVACANYEEELPEAEAEAMCMDLGEACLAEDPDGAACKWLCIHKRPEDVCVRREELCAEGDETACIEGED